MRQILLRRFISDRRRRWHGECATENLPERPVHDRTTATVDLQDEVTHALPLGIAVDTVKSQHRKALATLRISEHLADHHPADVGRRLGTEGGQKS